MQKVQKPIPQEDHMQPNDKTTNSHSEQNLMDRTKLHTGRTTNKTNNQQCSGNTRRESISKSKQQEEDHQDNAIERLTEIKSKLEGLKQFLKQHKINAFTIQEIQTIESDI